MIKYPTSPVFIEDVKYKDYPDAKLYLTRFQDADIPVLFIGNEEEKSVYTVSNVNPDEDYSLEEFEIAVKDYSENTGMLDWLIENGLVEPPHDDYISGYVMLPICRLSDRIVKFIKEHRLEADGPKLW